MLTKLLRLQNTALSRPKSSWIAWQGFLQGSLESRPRPEYRRGKPRTERGGSTAVPATAPLEAEPGAARTTLRPLAFCAIGLAGCAGAAYSFTSAFRNPAVGSEGEPLVIALLSNWLTASYVLCGALRVVAAAREQVRALMVAVGFANFISTLVDDQRLHVHSGPGIRPLAPGAVPAPVPCVSDGSSERARWSALSSSAHTRPPSCCRWSDPSAGSAPTTSSSSPRTRTPR